MIGGKQPAVNNFMVAGWQSLYFATVGRVAIARAVASDAMAFDRRISPKERTADSRIGGLKAAIERMLANAPADTARFPRVWGLGSKSFLVHAAGAVVILGLFAVGFAHVGSITDQPRTAYELQPPTADTQTSSAPARPVAVFDAPEQPPPRTGQIRSLWRHGQDEVLAPLKIVTADNGMSYYVKVVDSNTGRPKLILFVRSGETASEKIPIGTYDFKFATGSKWYGENFLFGPNTLYSRADKPLTFSTEGNDVVGHTLELVKQVNGNLEETPIAPTDF